MNGWKPGKPWTHPSIQRLTNEELRAKYASSVAMLIKDAAEFGTDPRDDAHELLRMDRESVDNYQRALESRGLQP
jgi:hypothetical protein